MGLACSQPAQPAAGDRSHPAACQQAEKAQAFALACGEQARAVVVKARGCYPTPRKLTKEQSSEPQNLFEIFGEPIHTYTRQQAIDDGFLVDVSSLAKEAGIVFPVAMTRAAWADCVEWSDADSKRQTYQDESGRLWDVLWMLKLAARRGGSEIRFQLYRVPRGGRGMKPRLAVLKAICGPGDAGEPVITICMPDED